MPDALWNVAAYTVQLAALVSMAVGAATVLRVRTPRHALRFWQVILAVALLLPLAQPRATSSRAADFMMQSLSVAAGTAATATADTSINIAEAVLIVLAAGVIARLIWLGVGVLRLRWIIARATPSPALDPVANELQQTLGVTADVRVTNDLEGPATVGLHRPIILVPPTVESMSTPVQRAILCHELLHVKRRDWLQTIGEEVWRSVWWFHPFARTIASRLSLARETVVDEQTLLITRDRRAYAQALLAFSDPQPHVMGVTPFIGRRTLSQRISLIAEEVSMSRRPALFRATLALIASLLITAAAVDRVPMFATVHAQSTVYKAGDGVTLPRVVKEVKPQYTAAAMQAKVQGSVWLEIVVNEKGVVTDVTVTRSLDTEYGLDDQAVAAARKWIFEPGRKDGKPVPVQVTLELTFTLKK